MVGVTKVESHNGQRAGRGWPNARTRRPRVARLVLAGGSAAVVVTAGMAATPAVSAAAGSTAAAPEVQVRQTNLVSDIPGVARTTDPQLVNPWGLALSPSSPVWVSDNGTDVSTLYAGGTKGSPLNPVPLTVTIPGGAPTGQVFNDSKGFVVHARDGSSGPAAFIFDSEAGVISGWNPGVPKPAPGGVSTRAVRAVTVPGAVYKGLAKGHTSRGSVLYAANFVQGRVDVFDSHFRRVRQPTAFRDPKLPRGYAPFNVANLGGRLYVTYGKQQPGSADEAHGPGLGLIDVYSLSGQFLKRLVTHGVLNAPWGLELAPSSFGPLAGDLLVGNFGDGRIYLVDPMSGALRGTLVNTDGAPIAIDGLWALLRANGTAGDRGELVFSAGISDEAHGLLGTLRPVG
jgi:uncharacterized protein (TIGR03118 family)